MRESYIESLRDPRPSHRVPREEIAHLTIGDRYKGELVAARRDLDGIYLYLADGRIIGESE